MLIIKLHKNPTPLRYDTVNTTVRVEPVLILLRTMFSTVENIGYIALFFLADKCQNFVLQAF